MANPFKQFVSFEEIRRERKKERTKLPLTPEEHERNERIVREISAFKREDLFLDAGEVADIYYGDPAEDMDGFVIKHKARTRAKSVYENSFPKEMECQVEAYEILDAARKRGTAVVEIPRPFAYLKSAAGEEFIAMERIRGKTFYRHLLDRLAAVMPDEHLLPGVKREDIPHLTDADLEDMTLNRFLNAKGKTRTQLYDALFTKIKPFLPPETAVAVRNTVKELHKNKFFHRDLHEKNLMLSDDLSRAFLIDFGSASVGKYENAADASDTEVLGTKLRFVNDTAIVGTLAKVVKKP